MTPRGPVPTPPMHALLVPLLLAVSAQEQPERATLLPTTALRRVEHFVLGGPAPSDPALGVARRVERVRGGELDLEHATHWFDSGTQVVHVEPVREQGPVLVWREWRERGGRTLVLERDAARALRSVSWQGDDAVRRDLPPRAERPRATPLRLLEHLRVSAATPAEVEVYDPLAEAFETLGQRTLVLARPGGVPLRLAVLARPGGDLAARYLLLGPALLAYQAQPGGPVARRCGSVRHDGLLLAQRESEGPGKEGVTKLLPASAGSLR